MISLDIDALHSRFVYEAHVNATNYAKKQLLIATRTFHLDFCLGNDLNVRTCSKLKIVNYVR